MINTFFHLLRSVNQLCHFHSFFVTQFYWYAIGIAFVDMIMNDFVHNVKRTVTLFDHDLYTCSGTECDSHSEQLVLAGFQVFGKNVAFEFSHIVAVEVGLDFVFVTGRGAGQLPVDALAFVRVEEDGVAFLETTVHVVDFVHDALGFHSLFVFQPVLKDQLIYFALLLAYLVFVDLLQFLQVDFLLFQFS